MIEMNPEVIINGYCRLTGKSKKDITGKDYFEIYRECAEFELREKRAATGPTLREAVDGEKDKNNNNSERARKIVQAGQLKTYLHPTSGGAPIEKASASQAARDLGFYVASGLKKGITPNTGKIREGNLVKSLLNGAEYRVSFKP